MTQAKDLAVPRLRVNVTFTLSHNQLVGPNLSPVGILSPTRYRGWLRNILLHYAYTAKLMPLPVEREGGPQNYVYRYLVSSSSSVPHKLLARLNILGYFFGGPVVGYAQIEKTLGPELATFYSGFLKSSLAVAKVNVGGRIQCQQYPQGVRDDLSTSAVANPHTVTICTLPSRTISVEFITLPHPYDLISAPEEAWNGVYSGQQYIAAFKNMLERLSKAINSIEYWRVSPFPGRSKNPVEKVEITIKEEQTTLVVDNAVLNDWNKKTALIAKKLTASLSGGNP